MDANYHDRENMGATWDLTLSQLRHIRAEQVILQVQHRPYVDGPGALCTGCEGPTEWPCWPWRLADWTKEWLREQWASDG